MLKHGTKNSLFGYFFGENLNKLWSCLKAAPSNFANCEISWKNKNDKFGTKNVSFGSSGARILKNYSHI